MRLDLLVVLEADVDGAYSSGHRRRNYYLENRNVLALDSHKDLFKRKSQQKDVDVGIHLSYSNEE